jgi:hypothetical protein
MPKAITLRSRMNAPIMPTPGLCRVGITICSPASWSGTAIRHNYPPDLATASGRGQQVDLPVQICA